MNPIFVSSPGKVILHGEHAVVYGKIALAASLDLRTYLQLTPTSDGQVCIDLPDIGIKAAWSVKEICAALPLPLGDPLQACAASEELQMKLKEFAGIPVDSSDTKSLALISFLYLYCAITGKDGKPPSLTIRVCSNLPPSAGLGSSAAYSSCLVSSLVITQGLVAPPSSSDTNQQGSWSGTDIELINQWAFQSEKIIHGRPSGIDNSISTFGGALSFQSGNITPLKRVPELRILLVNTKVPRSTKVLVSQFRERKEKYPCICDPICQSIEGIAVKCQEVLGEMAENTTDEHYKTLEELIDFNQSHLVLMGMSHPSLEEVRQILRKHGFHAKLTGAGGGGCAFTIIKPGVTDACVEQAKKELMQQGYDCWETVVGGRGVLWYNQQPTEMP